MYQALYRKWRPRTFEDVVGQTHITETLKRQVQSGRLSHAYLFTGTRGTGKTTCAKLLARAVNCQEPQDGSPCNRCDSCVGIENGSILDVLELDAASNNRVDDIRAILEEAVYAPAAVKKRVYIVDEVHMLSSQAFNALLQILEEPPEHLMFILATTEIHKVPATIKSRCQQFSFKRIRSEDIASRLRYVSEQEGIRLTENGGTLIARLADGGMRDALSLLDQCAGAGETVDESRVYEVLGLAGNLETAALMENIADGNCAAALERLNQIYTGGKEMTALVGELSSLTRDILVQCTAPQAGSDLMTGGFDEATLRRLGERFDIPRLVQMLGLLQRTAADLVRSSNRRTDVELCLTILCNPALDQTPAGLNARLARLEQGIAVPPAASSVQHEIEPVKKMAVSPPVKQVAPTEQRVEQIAPTEQVEERLNWPGWAAFRDSLKSELDIGDYSFFANDMVTGVLEGELLTLWAKVDFVGNMIDKKPIVDKVARRATQMVGQPVHVIVKVGTAPEEQLRVAAPANPPKEETDPLEAFLADGGDNLTVE